MAANTSPIFPLTPKIGTAVLATANTARTATGVTNLDGLITAGTSGARVDLIKVIGTGTVTAGVVRIWYFSSTGNAVLLKELLITATTPSTTVETFTVEWAPSNLVLPASSVLLASTHNAEGFNVLCFAGDY